MTLELSLNDGLQHKERFPASVSVSLLLTHGRSGRLFMVRHPVVTGFGNQHLWGLIAGGVKPGENPWQVALREAQEEANIGGKNIIFVAGRDPLEPHVALIQGLDKDRVGLVYSTTYSGPKFPFSGKQISDDPNVDMVACFSWRQVLVMLKAPQLNLYRPEFNFAQLMRWTIEKAARGKNLSRAKEVDTWFTEMQPSLEGLRIMGESDIEKPSDLLSKWSYAPLYNAWMMAKDIHGDPRRTNFARRRFDPNN